MITKLLQNAAHLHNTGKRMPHFTQFRSTVLVSVAVFLAGLTPLVHAQSYTFTALSLGGSGLMDANAINDSGQIVGAALNYGTGEGHAQLWSNGAMQDLGTLSGGNSTAAKINDMGQIVGTSRQTYYPTDPTTHGVLWGVGGVTDLGAVTPASINNNGQVVGQTIVGGLQRAFSWNAGVTTILPTLGGRDSVATDVNNNGQIVGIASVDFVTTNHATLWVNGHTTDLGTAFGAGIESGANAINDRGQVVGNYIESSKYHAVIWNNGTAISLGALGGRDGSNARDINNFGQVVGNASVLADGSQHAFIWNNGVMTDLNTLEGVVGSGWILSHATAINDLGQVIGIGRSGGVYGNFLLTPLFTSIAPIPEPETYAMLLAGLGLLGLTARRRRQKLNA